MCTTDSELPIAQFMLFFNNLGIRVVLYGQIFYNVSYPKCGKYSRQRKRLKERKNPICIFTFPPYEH